MAQNNLIPEELQKEIIENKKAIAEALGALAEYLEQMYAEPPGRYRG